MTLGDSSTQGANSTDAVYVDLAHTGSEVGAMPGLRSISAGATQPAGSWTRASPPSAGARA